MKLFDDVPKAFDKRSIGWQQDFGYSKPQGFSQLLIRYDPLRLLCMKLFELRIERLKPDKVKDIGGLMISVVV